MNRPNPVLPSQSPSARSIGRGLTLLGAAAVTALALCAPLAAQEAAAGSGALQEARDTLARWVETQRILAKEKKEWREAQDVLDQRIALLEGEISSLQGNIAEARRSREEVDGKHRDLAERKERIGSASEVLADEIGPLESRIRKILPSLPEPLRLRVSPLVGRLPPPSGETRMSLSERYQNAIGILNEIGKFNGTVTVATEVRDLPGGTAAEVETLYLGLAQAYYVTDRGDVAGIGVPSPDGWTWTPANDLAGKISRAIAILHDEQVPDFVGLPVRLQ